MSCPSCGAAVTADARFCSQCGTRLAAEAGAGAAGKPRGRRPGAAGAAKAKPAARAKPAGEAAGGRRRQHTRLPPRVDRQFGAPTEAEEADVAVEVLRDPSPSAPRAGWSAIESVLVDVSSGGIGVVSDEALPVGTQVRALMTHQGRTTRATGRVAYCAPVELFSGLPCYRCGIAFDRAQPAFVAALAGPAGGVGYLVSLGDVAMGQGDLAAARRWFEEGLALCQELHEEARVPRVLESLAVLAALDGTPERALRLAGAAAALRERLGVPATPAQHARVDGAIGAVRWGLTESQGAAAWAAGQKMDMSQAIGYALIGDMLGAPEA